MLSRKYMMDTCYAFCECRSGVLPCVNRCKKILKKVNIYANKTRNSLQSLYMCNNLPEVSLL